MQELGRRIVFAEALAEAGRERRGRAATTPSAAIDTTGRSTATVRPGRCRRQRSAIASAAASWRA